ncbi:N-acetyltransferase 10, partial [Binucleata daphniae]
MSKNNEFVVNKIQKAVKNNHRLFFVMEDAANIPYIYNCLKNNVDGCQPSVLWLYKKNKEAEIAQKIKTDVTFVNYGETDRILGNTHRMLILQDFEALTPNILAKSVETVQGGGVIILVASQIMDAEIEFEGDKRVYYRFNKRLYKTMKKNDSFLFFDKDMNVKHKRNTTEQASKKGDVYKYNTHSENTTERKEANYNEENVKKNKIDVSSVKERISSELKEKLYNLAKTEEQKQITKFLESKLDEKNCKTIVSLTAGRGRGKSAAFGLTASLAVFQSFSSILIASPAIENIATLFDFIILGLHALGYKEKIDYDVVKKVSNKKKYVCKLIIHKNQKQIIEYQNP